MVAYESTIELFGLYEYEAGEVLKISENENLIVLSLIDSNGHNILFYESTASKFQRWSVLWNGQELVLASSDIGMFVFQDLNGQGYLVEPLDLQKHVKIISSLPVDFDRYLKHAQN